MTKLSLREISITSQGHIANKQWSWDLNLGRLQDCLYVLEAHGGLGWMLAAGAELWVIWTSETTFLGVGEELDHSCKAGRLPLLGTGSNHCLPFPPSATGA